MADVLPKPSCQRGICLLTAVLDIISCDAPRALFTQLVSTFQYMLVILSSDIVHESCPIQLSVMEEFSRSAQSNAVAESYAWLLST